MLVTPKDCRRQQVANFSNVVLTPKNPPNLTSFFFAKEKTTLADSPGKLLTRKRRVALQWHVSRYNEVAAWNHS